MAYCSNCGRRLYADDNFCSGCGRPVSQVSTGSLSSPGGSYTPAVTEGRRPKSASVTTPSGNAGNSMQQTNASSSTVRLMRIIFITVFLILLSFGAVVFFDVMRHML